MYFSDHTSFSDVSMANHNDIAETIRSRIVHGDYRINGLPSGKGLALELGVNPRTVEKAMSRLFDVGVLRRLEGGRYEINHDEAVPQLHIALLAPAFPSG